jgi:hypothetical protein
MVGESFPEVRERNEIWTLKISSSGFLQDVERDNIPFHAERPDLSSWSVGRILVGR